MTKEEALQFVRDNFWTGRDHPQGATLDAKLSTVEGSTMRIVVVSVKWPGYSKAVVGTAVVSDSDVALRPKMEALIMSMHRYRDSGDYERHREAASAV